jgi:hypothetical protein
VKEAKLLSPRFDFIKYPLVFACFACFAKQAKQAKGLCEAKTKVVKQIPYKGNNKCQKPTVL